MGRQSSCLRGGSEEGLTPLHLLEPSTRCMGMTLIPTLGFEALRVVAYPSNTAGYRVGGPEGWVDQFR